MKKRPKITLIDRQRTEAVRRHGGTEPRVDLASVKAPVAAGLCPKCGSQVAAAAQNCPSCRINLAWARGHLDELARNGKASLPDDSKPEQDRALGDVPSGLLVQQGADGLKASFRWFSWRRFLVYVPGTVVSLLFCALFMWLVFDRSLAPGGGLSFVLMMIALALLVVGLWGLHSVLAILLNRTDTEVAGGELCFCHGPLAVRRRCSIICENLAEIAIEEVERKAVPVIIPYEGGGFFAMSVKLFQLNAWLQSGGKKALLSSPNRQVAVFLKSVIEKHSGIEAPMSER